MVSVMGRLRSQSIRPCTATSRPPATIRWALMALGTGTVSSPSSRMRSADASAMARFRARAGPPASRVSTRSVNDSKTDPRTNSAEPSVEPSSATMTSRPPSIPRSLASARSVVMRISRRFLVGMTTERTGAVIPGMAVDSMAPPTVGPSATEAWYRATISERGPERSNHTLVEPEDLVAHLLDGAEIVGHEEDRDSRVAEGLQPFLALDSEARIAHREDLVEKQDLCIDRGRHREGEPGDHPRRVGSDGLIDELVEIGERDDLLRSDLPSRPESWPSRAPLK